MSRSGERNRSSPSAAEASLAETMRARACAHASVPTVGHISAFWRDNRDARRADAENGSVSGGDSDEREGAAAAENAGTTTSSRRRSEDWTADGGAFEDDEGEDSSSPVPVSDARPSPCMRSRSTPHIPSLVRTSSLSRLGAPLTCAFLLLDGWTAREGAARTAGRGCGARCPRDSWLGVP